MPALARPIAVALFLAVSLSAVAQTPAKPAAAPQGQVAPPPFTKPGEPDPAFLPQPDRHTLFGMTWGDPVRSDMKQEDVKAPGVQFYKRPADVLAVDGVPVEAIHYVYEDGKLSGLSIQVSGSKKDAFAAALSKLWGAARPRSGGGLVWVTPGSMAALAPLGPPHEGSLVLSVYAR